MYQGKFDKKHKNTSQDILEITAQRNAEAAAQKRSAAEKKQAAAAAQKRAAANEQAIHSIPETNPKASKKAAKEVQTAPKKKGPRLGSVIFYTLYFLFIFLFFVAVYFGLTWLQGWLVDYEAAQPTTKSEEIFHQLFDDPDWGALYDAAGIADTEYEGKEAFVTYMEELVGDKELSYQLTSSGLSKDKKYFVNLEGKRLAYFTLHNANASESKTDIPDWQLGEVSLFYERANGYRIQTVDGHLPHINGIPLSDDHVIQISTMKEDDSGFLPSGVVATKTSVYEVTGLLADPKITVTDSNGQEMTVLYDEATDMFVEQTETIAISDAEREVALNALKVYAKYQIKEASSGEVGQYFDTTGSAYKSIMQTVLTWTKGNNGISFDKDSVTNYCRYGDNMFSAYVTTELTIKLTDGGTQTKPINSTLLFSKAGGTWKVTKMTNADIAETVGKVRLTFKNGNTVLANDFFDMESTSLKTPLLSVPTGKVFSGWYRESVKADGSVEQFLVFVPDENGTVTIPSGTTLEPMVLYPLFEDTAAAEAAATEGA
ncbi:MAG: hypothetical protein IKY96_01490 [Oscillospiraceae bacterium]|nr:hypothetical protein [Oscillospiraceae bacterium]